jgi:Tol biopolymer transport system component
MFRVVAMTNGRAVVASIVAVILTGCSSQASPASTLAGTASPPVAITSQPIVATPTPGPTPWVLGTGQIVFENYRIAAGQHQVWIADGSGVRHLVFSSVDDARPSLSPDGKTVLFERYGANGGGDQAFLVNVDGSNLRPLPSGPGDPEGDAWSPDGRELAVDRGFGPVFTNANGDEEATNVSIWIVNVDGTQLREVTKNPTGSNREDHRPAWSPDGKRLAFARTNYAVNPQITAIFTVAIDGTNLRQVTPWKLDANEPDWSPDGTLIAFSSPAASLRPGREQNIFTIHPDGTGLRQLTSHLEAAADGSQGTFDPSWSPDGTQLIFTHIPSFGGLADLYVMNADGSGLHVLAKTSDLNEGHAVWGAVPVP